MVLNESGGAAAGEAMGRPSQRRHDRRRCGPSKRVYAPPHVGPKQGIAIKGK